MGSNKIKLTREKRLPVMGFVCSECGNPIVANIYIGAEATVQESLTKDMTVKKVGKLADEELEKMYDKLKNCQAMGVSLAVKETKSTMAGYTSTSIYGASNPCPCCGALQVWQKGSKSDRYNWSRLPKENFLMEFESENLARKWAEERLEEKKEEAKEYWRQNESVLAELKKDMETCSGELAENETRIAKLRRERDTLPAQVELRSKLEERSKLETVLNRAGFFSRTKREAKREMESIEGEISLLKKKVAEEEVKYDTEIETVKNAISKCKDRVKELEEKMKGSSGEVVGVKDKFFVCYILK